MRASQVMREGREGSTSRGHASRRTRPWIALCVSALCVSVVACDGASPATDAGVDAGAALPATVGPNDRPAALYAPPAHDGRTALPLVLLLHGRGVVGSAQDLYFGMTREARRDGFYVVIPDGPRDAGGTPYWDVYGLAVDDHGYLRGLIEETVALVPVSTVWVVGHSNGGFMAYRLACDSADLVDGVASLAGADAIPVESCAPARPVAVLQIHGTADDTVSYDGGEIAGLTYPSAEETARRWAERAGCEEASPVAGESLDLVSDLPGAETEVGAYSQGCAAPVQLWTIREGSHIPGIGAEFTPSVIAFLRAAGSILSP